MHLEVITQSCALLIILSKVESSIMFKMNGSYFYVTFYTEQGYYVVQSLSDLGTRFCLLKKHLLFIHASQDIH